MNVIITGGQYWRNGFVVSGYENKFILDFGLFDVVAKGYTDTNFKLFSFCSKFVWMIFVTMSSYFR